MALSHQQSPRYRPWEQKDLLSRLQTFKPRSWFGKPAQISAVTCARHGWINSGPDNLECEVSVSSSWGGCYSALGLTALDAMQFCGECLDLPIRPKWSLHDVQKVSHGSRMLE